MTQTLRDRAFTALLVALILLVCSFVAASLLALTGCASVAPDPSPEHPRVACIARGLGQLNPLTGGKVMPEIVRLIGRTSPEDGERWMVVRGYYNRQACVSDLMGAECGWLPFHGDEIRIGAVCGPEAQAFIQLDRQGEQP
jgi:hypothetical protein